MPRKEKTGYSTAVSCIFFAAERGLIIEENQVDISTGPVGEIVGTQGGGKVGSGTMFGQQGGQLGRCERGSFAGGAGKEEVFRGGLETEDGTVGTVLFYGLPQAKSQTAAGQGGGNEDTAAGGEGSKGFRKKEGDPHSGKFWG